MTSALFGHRKGAFTGAVADVAGKVQEAEGGTLLLDEVGDLTADAQARLLRFLNDRTYERLGEARERQADVRLIAATNRDLEAEVRTGRFREDLFYRLNVLTLTLPALRDRPEDTLLLARHYLSIFGRKQRRPGVGVLRRDRTGDSQHTWPGNLRELRNAVERAVILALHDMLEPSDLGLSAATDRRMRTESPRPRASARRCRSNRWNANTLLSVIAQAPRWRPRRASWTSTPRRCSGSASDTGWRDRVMIPGRLRFRFVVAAGLLVLTTVMASVWTFPPRL